MREPESRTINIQLIDVSQPVRLLGDIISSVRREMRNISVMPSSIEFS